MVESYSEADAKSELHVARVLSAAHRTKVAGKLRRARGGRLEAGSVVYAVELRVIEGVIRFAAELDNSFVLDRPVLEERGIKIAIAGQKVVFVAGKDTAGGERVWHSGRSVASRADSGPGGVVEVRMRCRTCDGCGCAGGIEPTGEGLWRVVHRVAGEDDTGAITAAGHVG